MKRSKSHCANIQTIVGLRFVIDDYEVITIEKLSDDMFSSIYSCVDTTGALHILKIFQTTDRDFLSSVLRGIVIHTKLGHHYNLLRLEGYSSSDMSIQVLMEYCDHSLVNELTRATNRGLTTDKIAEIFSSILAAVKYIHSQNPPVIHRGINPKSILCQKGVWKLCYFLSATTRVYHTDDENERKLACDDITQNTNPIYRAPEMVDLYRGQVIDAKSDIWSLGCLLYRLCTLKDAFPEGKSLSILNGKYQWDQPWPVDEYFKNIVARCLNPNPQVRPTAAELDEQVRSHFKLGPTPEAPEKAVRMTDRIHHFDYNDDQQSLMPNPIHASSLKLNQPPTGAPIIQASHQTQNIPHQPCHIQLDYYSYTKALLHILPPDDQASDESDIEVIEEKKTTNKNENKEKENNNEKFDKEMNEIILDREDEEEEDENQDTKKRRPSVIQLSTTIENLIEFGEEPSALVKNTVNKFNVVDSKHETHHHDHYNTVNDTEDNNNYKSTFSIIENTHHTKDFESEDNNGHNKDFNSEDTTSHKSVFNLPENNHHNKDFNSEDNSHHKNIFNTMENNHYKNVLDTDDNDHHKKVFNTEEEDHHKNIFNTYDSHHKKNIFNSLDSNHHNKIHDTFGNNHHKNIYNTLDNNNHHNNPFKSLCIHHRRNASDITESDMDQDTCKLEEKDNQNNSFNTNNNNPFNTTNNTNNIFNNTDNNNNNVFNTMNNQNDNNNNNVFNNTKNSKNDNIFNTMNRGNNNNNVFNNMNSNNGNNVFNNMNSNTNNNVFNNMNNNNNAFNTNNANNITFNTINTTTTNNMNRNDNNHEIFKAFDNYNKAKNIQKDIMILHTNNTNNQSKNNYSNNNAFNSYSTQIPTQQIDMNNKISSSTGNMNQTNTNNGMLDNSDSVDDLFRNATQAKTPDYKTIYQTNPEQLKVTLLKLDNLSLSTALYQFMSTDESSYYILSLARDSGIKGTRILCHIPALPPSTMNNYIQQRKQFLINFPMFEANFSLYDFTQQIKGKPPPTPGTPPCSVDVAIQLIKVLDSFLKAFADHQRATVLAEDGYDAFQTLSYVIAKLKFFKIQQSFVDSSIIPLYNNLHRRILDAFTRAQFNANFPAQPFNFDDQEIVKKLRAPKHRDIYEQTQGESH